MRMRRSLHPNIWFSIWVLPRINGGISRITSPNSSFFPTVTIFYATFVAILPNVMMVIMKIKELKNKIVIAELDPNTEYICIADPSNVKMSTLVAALKKHRVIPIVIAYNIDKAIKFIEVKSKTHSKWLKLWEKFNFKNFWKERMPRFIKIKQKDIKGKYNLKIKVNKSVPNDRVFFMADDKLSEWRQEYTQKKGFIF